MSSDSREIPEVLLVAVILGVVTATTKLLGGRWGASRHGVGPAGQRRTGLALMARGEFSIIIAGLAAGVAGAEGLPALAATYVLLMAVTGPLEAKLAEPRRRGATVGHGL